MYKLLFLLMPLLTFGISYDCSPGEYSQWVTFPPPAHYVCLDCPENTVSNGIDGCYECDSDSIPNAHQSDCEPECSSQGLIPECYGNGCMENCPSGMFWEGSECDACWSGTYCVGGGCNMQSCPRGMVSGYNASSCTLCSPGTVPENAPGYGNEVCAECPAGTYHDGEWDNSVDFGSTESCIDCTGNQYSSSPGSTSYSICDDGSIVNDDNSECNICPSGYACDGATQTMCEAGTYAPIGSTICIECGSANEYAPPGSSSCQTCDEGYVPNDNSAECVQIQGCTYSSAANYNPDALIDDGSCNSFFTQDDIDNAAIEAYIEGAQSGDINGSGHLNVTDIIMYIDKIIAE